MAIAHPGQASRIAPDMSFAGETESRNQCLRCRTLPDQQPGVNSISLFGDSFRKISRYSWISAPMITSLLSSSSASFEELERAVLQSTISLQDKPLGEIIPYVLQTPSVLSQHLPIVWGCFRIVMLSSRTFGGKLPHPRMGELSAVNLP